MTKKQGKQEMSPETWKKVQKENKKMIDKLRRDNIRENLIPAIVCAIFLLFFLYILGSMHTSSSSEILLIATFEFALALYVLFAISLNLSIASVGFASIILLLIGINVLAPTGGSPSGFIAWSYIILLSLSMYLVPIIGLLNSGYRIMKSKSSSGSSIGSQGQYRVYKNPQNNFKAVKVGWSHPGFFFVVFWCLSKQLWAYAGIVFVIGFVLSVMLNPLLSFIATLGIMVWMGSSGNELYAKNLKDRGYDLLTTLNAKTPEGAIAQYQKDAQKDKED